MKIQKTGVTRTGINKKALLSPRYYVFEKAFDVFELHGIPSVTAIKAKAKHKFRELAFKIHPDTGKRPTITRKTINNNEYGIYFRDLKRMYDKIQKMKFMPIDIDNVNQILNLSREFKTTDEVDYGLNGPA